jgi:hypothetical protein
MSASAEPVVPPGPPLRQRRWVPVLVLALLMVGIVSGGYLTSDALGEAGGETVAVSSSVNVTALPGWELADRFEGPTGIRLTKGGASTLAAEGRRLLRFLASDADTHDVRFAALD